MATGYVLRRLEWEGRIPAHDLGPAKALAGAVGVDEYRLGSTVASWEPDSEGKSRVGPTFVEVVCDNEDDCRFAREIGSHLFGADLWHRLDALVPPGQASPTRNRPLSADITGVTASEDVPSVIDLRVTTAPNTHGNLDVQYTSRWLRLFVTQTTVLAWWQPCFGGSWSPERVRWPHHALPLPSPGGLSDLSKAEDATAIVSTLLGDIVGHLLYYLERWPDELDAVEAGLLHAFASDADPLDDVDVGESKVTQLIRLADLLNQMGADLRGIARRLESEDVLLMLPNRSSLRERIDEGLDEIRSNENRRRLAFSTLASLGAGQQIRLANKQRAATERLQTTVVWVSALLLAPGLVVGVFGANLSNLAEGASGSLQDLLAWAFVFSGASATLLLAVQRIGTLGIRCVFGLLALSAALGLLLVLVVQMFSGLWLLGLTAGVWLCATAMVLAPRLSVVIKSSRFLNRSGRT